MSIDTTAIELAGTGGDPAGAWEPAGPAGAWEPAGPAGTGRTGRRTVLRGVRSLGRSGHGPGWLGPFPR